MESMNSDANTHGAVYSHVSIDNLLNPIGEYDVLEEVDLSTQAILIAAHGEFPHHESSVTQQDEEKVEFSTIEQLKGFAVAKFFLSEKGSLVKV